ncbi:elongator complex protein 3 [Patescibacteria group bacterium]
MILEDIINQLNKSKAPDNRLLGKLSRQYAKSSSQPCASKMDLLKVYRRLIDSKKLRPNPSIEKLLRTRAIRTLSGVAIISVLMKPHPCPGDCLFCPTEMDVPKSYSPNEPAVMRAILCKFDPYKQVRMRLRALNLTGHDTSKCELIIIGATFSAYPKPYQRRFIKRCFDAFNHHNYSTLTASQKANTKAKHRCIGMSVETRPDTIDEAEVKRLRELGITRIELGIQHLDDKILNKNHRDHSVAATIKATKLLKDAGLKINYHMMPGLYGSTDKKDLMMFKELFSNPDFQPDMLKIYPCTVVKNSKLYKLWKQKKYRPLSAQRLAKLLVQIKTTIPRYVRITRLIRDIPSSEIVGGSKVTNLRQVVQRKMRSAGQKCRCIRCREAREQPAKASDVKLFVQKYQASGGTEYFLSFENRKRETLFAFLRLRFPAQTFLPELKGATLIRELHTYGQVVPVGKTNKKAAQHLGLGRKLMQEAERIAQRAGYGKMAVISGIGVRDYYRKLGYRLHGTYMVKSI